MAVPGQNGGTRTKRRGRDHKGGRPRLPLGSPYRGTPTGGDRLLARRHPIDPKIDCVFKALLGAEDNRVLLIHFLNALLGRELPAPVSAVEILNPYNEREFLDDKLSIVDVKARDAQGRLYQVEIQILPHADLPARMLYAWADLHSQQLHSGQNFRELRPTYAIWLLGDDLVRDDPAYAQRYRLRDERGRTLLEHGGISLFELSKSPPARSKPKNSAG